MEARTVIVSGASKTYSWTGGRLGWAVFPTADEAQVFKNLNINYISCVPPYNQMGAKLAMPVVEQFYGMKEFAFEDPDGYTITIAQKM